MALFGPDTPDLETQQDLADEREKLDALKEEEEERAEALKAKVAEREDELARQREALEEAEADLDDTKDKSDDL